MERGQTLPCSVGAQGLSAKPAAQPKMHTPLFPPGVAAAPGKRAPLLVPLQELLSDGHPLRHHPGLDARPSSTSPTLSRIPGLVISGANSDRLQLAAEVMMATSLCPGVVWGRLSGRNS